LFFFVLHTQCCHFLWIVHFSLPLRFFLTFIGHERKVIYSVSIPNWQVIIFLVCKGTCTFVHLYFITLFA
jgi:hypothetical protein